MEGTSFLLKLPKKVGIRKNHFSENYFLSIGIARRPIENTDKYGIQLHALHLNISEHLWSAEKFCIEI
jgi:hypothetical protein